MSTESQVSANRRNATKSTGPKTTVGKAVVAQNALKHGLLARQDVVMGEDPRQFDLHRTGILAELAPVGNLETLFAEQIVSLSWRLRRAGRLQNEVFDSLLARELRDSMLGFLDELTPKDEVRLRSDCKTDPTYAVGRMVAKDYHDARVLDRLQMYEQRIAGTLHRTLADLERFQLKRTEDGGHSPPYQTDSAKQSQLREVSSVKREVSSSDPALQTSNLTLHTCQQTPCGVTTNGHDSAEQSQF